MSAAFPISGTQLVWSFDPFRRWNVMQKAAADLDRLTSPVSIPAQGDELNPCTEIVDSAARLHCHM